MIVFRTQRQLLAALELVAGLGNAVADTLQRLRAD
jgi:hypothetical protein